MQILDFSDGHDAFRKEMIALYRKHVDHLPPIEILAIAAQLVGQLMALQPKEGPNGMVLFETIIANLERGNHGMIEAMRAEKGPIQ